MRIAIVHGRAIVGVTACSVTIEVHLANGLPAFTLVGLPEAEVRESRDRVRAAIQTAGFDFPAARLTVNLAPADLPKSSGRFDLPIAIGILFASGQLPNVDLAQFEFAGELGLTGELRAIRGVLPTAMGVAKAGRTLVVPHSVAAEAALVEEVDVLSAPSLLAVCQHLTGEVPLARPSPLSSSAFLPLYADLSDIKGQHMPRRALELAAAGRHSLLMIGPPGTGKSMLATRLPGILPSMSVSEALEAAAIQSLGTAGFSHEQFKKRPFRAPHHTVSAVALVGGGSDPRPGEISLSHRGVLFLDELPEFDRKVLEVLREPLESGRILISRAARQAEFPARFQLVAAMNPCPCGYYGHPRTACHCTPDQVKRYKAKISGPLLDRIDLAIEVPSILPEELGQRAAGESSQIVRERVEAAWQRQLMRQSCANAELQGEALAQHAQIDSASQNLLTQAAHKLNLSARAYHRILRLARTLADLAASDTVQISHVAEAIQFRRHL